MHDAILAEQQILNQLFKI